MRFLLSLLICFALISCGTNEVENDSKKTGKANSGEPKPVFLFVGDSLTAGYGVDIEDCFVSLLKKDFEKSQSDWQIKNAGISGETSSGTLERIDWLIASKPKIIFLCIGSNDGLRGISADLFQKNLEKIIEKIKTANIKLVLAGIQIPVNFGLGYSMAIKAVPANLANKYSLLYYPFLLEGVAGEENLNQDDLVHPNAIGHAVIYKKLKSFFKINNIP